MSIGDIPVLSLLKSKMKWHQARQKILAQNVANANTPGYMAQDLKAMEVPPSGRARSPFAVTLERTNAAHISAPGDANARFETKTEPGWEITPSGNGVVLEEQMVKVTENQMDFQMASTLYARSLALLRTAIGN
jgi:flagellar basal-body rod protein FlgB